MENNTYILTKEYNGHPIGTEIILREYYGSHVYVTIGTKLDVIPKLTFWDIIGRT